MHIWIDLTESFPNLADYLSTDLFSKVMAIILESGYSEKSLKIDCVGSNGDTYSSVYTHRIKKLHSHVHGFCRCWYTNAKLLEYSLAVMKEQEPNDGKTFHLS